MNKKEFKKVELNYLKAKEEFREHKQGKQHNKFLKSLAKKSVYLINAHFQVAVIANSKEQAVELIEDCNTAVAGRVVSIVDHQIHETTPDEIPENSSILWDEDEDDFDRKVFPLLGFKGKKQELKKLFEMKDPVIE